MSVGNIEDIVGAGDVGIGGALDPATGALPVQRVDDPRFDDFGNPVFVNETNKAAGGPYYYPDMNGVSMLGFRSLSFFGEITAAAETWVFIIQGSNDGINWQNVSGQFLDDTGTQPVPGAQLSVTGGQEIFGWSKAHFDFKLFRASIEITGTVTANSAKIGSYQKAI